MGKLQCLCGNGDPTPGEIAEAIYLHEAKKDPRVIIMAGILVFLLSLGGFALGVGIAVGMVKWLW